MAEVTLVCLHPKDGVIEMELRARRSFSTCPACGTASRRVHSHYQRKLADFRWAVCRWLSCSRPGSSSALATVAGGRSSPSRYLARWHATRGAAADRAKVLHWLTFALGGRPGARLARRLGLLACRSTLLRSLRYRMQPTAVTAPRVLGIDDWAWIKAHRYGTILCDLEAGKVVDLLPDARQQPWPHGCKIIPEQKSSAVIGPVLMPRPPAEPLRKRSRSPIVGTLCAT
jgi:hypothetical protein